MMHCNWTEFFKRPTRIFACALAMSLFLAGAFLVQELAYEEHAREAAAAAERVHALKQQDYELRFHAEEAILGASLTQREALKRNAEAIRAAEAALERHSDGREQLWGMSLIWTAALTSSYLSGLLLAACLLLLGASRLMGRRARIRPAPSRLRGAIGLAQAEVSRAPPAA